MVEPKIICWYQTWAKFIFGVGSINDLVTVCAYQGVNFNFSYGSHIKKDQPRFRSWSNCYDIYL